MGGLLQEGGQAADGGRRGVGMCCAGAMGQWWGSGLAEDLCEVSSR
eukprot:CAMPEP_0184380210 /NCGR_PEP_ID=MMETSP0007-20130409/4546_1 /TAXON_ID=97485 /ORGANISM="Prymnesium parvum, Strain Texoma1" /LENGTH=45 /DNA_ID= /DNA_START= /DNA_END= /DNA_ORIENTATION=